MRENAEAAEEFRRKIEKIQSGNETEKRRKIEVHKRAMGGT